MMLERSLTQRADSVHGLHPHLFPSPIRRQSLVGLHLDLRDRNLDKKRRLACRG
jgi:hypothetical protein